MTVPRLAAIIVILMVATVGWFVLGASVDYRTDWADGRSSDAVGDLWGRTQVQTTPVFTGGGRGLDIVGSDIEAVFDLEQRKKGLLWYATYAVDFSAVYRVDNDTGEEIPVTMALTLPAADGVYDGFTITLGDEELPVRYQDGKALVRFDIAPRSTAEVTAGYRTNGLGEWRYDPTGGDVDVIEDFSLVMHTDFADVDFPAGSVSPTSKEETDAGWILTWEYDSLVSGRPIALGMPTPINPGPMAARISFFAPVSLLFYFAALILLTATQNVRIHPMNYAFLAAGFFAFHLLFAYLVDRIDIGVAFAIASVTSVSLCTGYLWMVVGRSRAFVEIAVSQFVFLVLFSFSFFFEGFTGLAVTVGSVLTLAYFMAKTGHVDWEQVFVRPDRA